MLVSPELSSESNLIRETINKFCNKEIKPVLDLFEKSGDFPEETFLNIFKGLARIGCLGLLIPQDYGGSDGDFTSVAIVLEELGKVSPGIGFSYLAHTPVMAYANIYMNGTEEQKTKYLDGMCKGEIIGANAVTEPEAGSDLFSIRTTAMEHADYFTINGSKTFITNARVANVFYVLAKDKTTDEKMTGFLVDRDSKGISIGKDLDKCGYRSSPTSEVFFEDCRIPRTNVLGKRGKGLRLTLSEIELQRIYLAFIALGLSEAALEEALNYAKQRIQFGKPISEFQMIQSMLADMAIDVEVSRIINYKAIAEYEKMKRSKAFDNRFALALIAKKFASTSCVGVVLNAMQIHGSYGFIKEYPVERFYRDAKLIDIAGGTNEMLKLSIARLILK